MQEGKQVEVTLTNPIDSARRDELIIIPLSELGGVSADGFVVRQGEKILAAQAEDTDFDGKADAIAFLAGFGPSESVKVSIVAGEAAKPAVRAHAEISILSSRPEAKTGGTEVSDGEYVSKKELVMDLEHKIHDKWYRFEGPLIESEKVGYRLYWDKRGAIDAYGKPSDMFVGDAHRGNHHTLQPWGRDILFNGKAIGVGGLGLGTDINRFSPAGAPYSKVIIGSDGPIRASYRIEFKQVQYKGKEYELVWDVSMSAGQHYMANEVKVLKGGELEMLAGLTNHSKLPGVTGRYCWAEPGKLDWVGTFGKQVAEDEVPEMAAKSKEQMGLGLLWEHELLAKLDINEIEFDAAFKASEQIKYYALTTYNGEPESPIMTGEEFYAYMEELARCLANPIEIKVGK